MELKFAHMCDTFHMNFASTARHAVMKNRRKQQTGGRREEGTVCKERGKKAPTARKKRKGRRG